MVGSFVFIQFRFDWSRTINNSKNGNGLRHASKKRVTITDLKVIAFLLTPLSVILSLYRRESSAGRTVPNCLRSCLSSLTLQQ